MAETDIKLECRKVLDKTLNYSIWARHSLGKFHDGVDHVVTTLAEGGNSLIAGALGMLNDKINVVGGNALFGERSVTTSGLGLFLLDGGGGSCSLGGGELTFSELLGFGLLHAHVGVLKLELSEHGERFAIVGSEHLGVIDNENEAVSLSESNAGDTSETLHADLNKSFAAFLLATVELGSILVFEFGHFLLIVVTVLVVLVLLCHLKFI